MPKGIHKPIEERLQTAQKKLLGCEARLQKLEAKDDTITAKTVRLRRQINKWAEKIQKLQNQIKPVEQVQP